MPFPACIYFVLLCLCLFVLVVAEEVLSTNYALWWSPDGAQILYLSINDTPVRDFMFPLYGPATDQYTQIDTIAYPKVGGNVPS